MDQRHPLYVLAAAIDWKFFEREFGSLYVEQKGRPGLPMRLLVRLHYLKHLYSVSDERVAERIGPGGMEQLLAETIAVARRQQALKPSELRRVNVDTTVQEKAIAFPRRCAAYHKARCVLVREAKRGA